MWFYKLLVCLGVKELLEESIRSTVTVQIGVRSIAVSIFYENSLVMVVEDW